MHVSHKCQSAPWQFFLREFTSNKFFCALPVFAVQSSAPVDEVSRSIIHLLRQVIKRCHSLPKLGPIIPAVQAVYPASCSSPLTDQDIQCKERDTYWSDCISQRCTRALSNPPFLLTWNSNLQIQYVSFLFQHPHMMTLSVQPLSGPCVYRHEKLYLDSML